MTFAGTPGLIVFRRPWIKNGTFNISTLRTAVEETIFVNYSSNRVRGIDFDGLCGVTIHGRRTDDSRDLSV